MRNPLGIYFLAWFPLLLIAIANGAIRDLTYQPILGFDLGHQLSTITLLGFFLLFGWVLFRRYPAHSSSHALTIGLMWMMLTLLFEFGLGRWNGKSWSELMADYNLAAGRIWILIPIGLLLMPRIFYGVFGKNANRNKTAAASEKLR